MKIIKLEFSTIVTGIVAIPALAFSMLVFGTDNTLTPGAKEPAAVDSRSYVPPANVYVPDSSKAVPGDAGKRAHTNILIQSPGGTKPKAISDLSRPAPAAKPN